MADAPKQNALMKFGPIGAPAVGAVLMLLFVVLALVLGDTDAPKRKIDDAVSKINSRLADPKISEPPPEFKATGLHGANKNFGVATGGKIPAKLANEHLLLDFPVQIKVMLDVPPTTDDGFDACDKNPNDGKHTREEYANSGKYKSRIKFKTLDVNRDGYLSRVEYDATPDETVRSFDWFDQEGARNNTDDGDDQLTKDEYERLLNPATRTYDPSGKTDFAAKDKDSNGFLSREEYGKVDTGPNPVDLNAPTDVTAAANSKDFVITVNWSAPVTTDAPSDLGYWVLRKSPKDLEDRKRDYNTKDLPAWRAKADAWDKKKKEWKGPAEEFEKQNGSRPVKPPTPTEWERLNDTPVMELTFKDVTFRAEYTYTYAVRATTASKTKLKSGTKTDDAFAEGYHTSAATEMAGRPVVVYNRIEMAWQAKAAATAKIKLRKFHPIGGTWRAVEAVVEVAQGDEVGGIWDVAAMKDRNYEPRVVDAEGKPNADWLKALEASKDKIDFTTGWAFNRFVGSDIELGQKGGSLRFVLPKETKEPAKEPPMDPSGMANPLAIRLFCIDKGGATARFEITRWKQVNNRWYRIVAHQDVKKGEDIGYTTAQIKDLKANDMIFFFDDGGLPVPEAKVAELTLRDISMETGLTFGGIAGRTIDLGAGKMDIWGVYYVDK